MSEVNTFGLPQSLYDLAKDIYELNKTDSDKLWNDLTDLEKLSKTDIVVDVYNAMLAHTDEESVLNEVKTLWSRRDIPEHIVSHIHDIFYKVKHLTKE